MTKEEFEKELSQTPNWNLVNNRLEKTFVFDNFARAVVFVNKIVNPIEETENYPHILIQYNRVHVSIRTPESKEILARDFQLARDLDKSS